MVCHLDWTKLSLSLFQMWISHSWKIRFNVSTVLLEEINSDCSSCVSKCTNNVFVRLSNCWLVNYKCKHSNVRLDNFKWTLLWPTTTTIIEVSLRTSEPEDKMNDKTWRRKSWRNCKKNSILLNKESDKWRTEIVSRIAIELALGTTKNSPKISKGPKYLQ